jgi:hypothetical protein
VYFVAVVVVVVALCRIFVEAWRSMSLVVWCVCGVVSCCVVGVVGSMLLVWRVGVVVYMGHECSRRVLLLSWFWICKTWLGLMTE